VRRGDGGARGAAGRWGHAPLLLIPAATFAALGALTWRRWGELLVDGYQSTELAMRLARGEVLYRDARYYGGPMAPYLNALALRLLGERLEVLFALGLASAAVVAWLVHRLSRRFVGPVASALASSAFLAVLAFEHLDWTTQHSFVLPYSFSSTYGIAFALLALERIVAALDCPAQRAPVLHAGLALLGLALNRPELAIGAAAIALVALVLDRGRRARPVLLRDFALLAGPVLLGSGGIYGAFAALAGAHELLLENLAWHGHSLSHGGQQVWIFGFDLARVLATLRSTGLLGALLAGAVAGQRLWERGAGLGPRRLAALGLAAAGGAAFLALQDPGELLAATPVLVAASLLAATARLLRDRSAAAIRAWILPTFAGLFLARTFLRCRPDSYFFYLGVPSLVVWARLFAVDAPAVARELRLAHRARFYLAAVAAVAIAGSIAVASESLRFYDRKTLAVVSRRGTAYAFDTEGLRAFVEVVRFLEETPEGSSVYVAPLGTAAGFLAGRPSRCRLPALIPSLLDSTPPTEIVVELARCRPTYLVLLHAYHPPEIFGEERALFPKNPRARPVLDWMRRSYVPVARIGSPPFEARAHHIGGALLLRDRSAPGAPRALTLPRGGPGRARAPF
jgi:hypothetical protein